MVSWSDLHSNNQNPSTPARKQIAERERTRKFRLLHEVGKLVKNSYAGTRRCKVRSEAEEHTGTRVRRLKQGIANVAPKHLLLESITA